MKSVKETLIDNIKCLRSKRSWSQMKLAEEASLSPGMIGDIETYKKTPSLETIEKIANAFNVPVSRLFLNPDEDENDVRLRTNKEKIDKAIEILRSLE